jgi:hypothetical protein
MGSSGMAVADTQITPKSGNFPREIPMNQFVLFDTLIILMTFNLSLTDQYGLG